MERVTVYWCTTDDKPQKEDVSGCENLNNIVNILKRIDTVIDESILFVHVKDEYSKDLDKTFVWRTATYYDSTEETLVGWYYGIPDSETTLECIKVGANLKAEYDYGFKDWKIKE